MRNNKGFTLVELAVVLVIIGIILGAVIKGQDLITNAQAKQAASAVSSWRNLTYAYLDRNGRYPGDASRNGIIGDSITSIPSEQGATGTTIAEIVNSMNYAPANPVTIGGLSFWIYFGRVSSTDATPVVRNAMFICKTVDCAVATTFSLDELEIIKSLDASYDGVADAGLGTFRAPSAVTFATGTAQNGRANGLVTASAAGTTAGATATWATTHFAAAWLFDRTF